MVSDDERAFGFERRMCSVRMKYASFGLIHHSSQRERFIASDALEQQTPTSLIIIWMACALLDVYPSFTIRAKLHRRAGIWGINFPLASFSVAIRVPLLFLLTTSGADNSNSV